MSRAGWVIVLALACGAGGCPGDDDSAAGAINGSSGSNGDPCDEWKAWKLRCAPDAGPDDLDYYDECRVLHWNKVQPAFTRAMADCFPTLSCDEVDDDCSAKGYAAVGVTKQNASDDVLVQDCLKAIDGCHFGDDLCFSLTALIDSARSEAGRCSTDSCDGYDTCVRAIFGEPERK